MGALFERRSREEEERKRAAAIAQQVDSEIAPDPTEEEALAARYASAEEFPAESVDPAEIIAMGASEVTSYEDTVPADMDARRTAAQEAARVIRDYDRRQSGGGDLAA